MSKVNRAEFADIVGFSAKWISKFIDDGMPCEGGGGKGKALSIDTQKAIKWLIAREVARQVGAGSDVVAGTLEGEELLLLTAKRRKAEVEANKAEESVMPLEDVSQFLYAIATIYGNELNGLGARIAPEVAIENDTAKCKHIIDLESGRVRTATANRLISFVDEYIATRSEDDESPATEERSDLGDNK